MQDSNGVSCGPNLNVKWVRGGGMDENQRRKKQSFLEKHRHGLVWITSLMLFAVLFVREFVGNKAKEEADAVANARNLFSMRMDVLRAADQIIENIEPENATQS